jgi:Na+/H+-dicarboxylate symporter/ABC-type amino acid transport substrate-binding protein
VSRSRKILLGLVLGIATGLFLGERAAWFQPIADGYVKLLQMTVLPVITVSIISGLGSLTHAEARILALRAGGVLLLLWGLALVIAFLFPLMLQPMTTASFFSTTLIEPPRSFDLVELYIPANPFYSLANNIVPAVVLFSIVTGIALIGATGKPKLIEVLAVVRDALSRAATYVVRLTPIGLFAIAATFTGTLSIDQMARIQIYLIGYVALSLLISLWILPGLIATLTPIPYRRVLSQLQDALITAFVTSDLFIVLPQLTEQSKALAHEYGLTGDREHAADVIVPASFNFPHTGKLLTLTFIFFAAWFTDVTVRLSQYPQLAFSALLAFFGSLNVAVPFLLDLFRIPSDTFQLFLATSVVNSRFGTLMAAMHTVAMAILGTWAMAGALRLEPRRLVRYAVISVLLTAATIGSVRLLVGRMIDQGYEGNQVLGRMHLGDLGPTPQLVPSPPDAAVPAAADRATARAVLDDINDRGVLRAGILPDSLPFAYRNASNDYVGFDIAMAQVLARELHLQLQLVPLTRESWRDAVSSGGCDLVMSGVALTTERAADTTFSQPYLDETIALIVPDHARDQFATWNGLRARPHLRLGIVDVPYYVDKVVAAFPDAEVTRFQSVETMFTDGQARGLDGFVLTAERGSSWTLLHPELSVVVPTPGLVKVPLAYPVARRDAAFAAFIDIWIDLKKKDGTIQRLYDYWILGRDAVQAKPRWSVIRNVLHWVE